MGAAKLHDFEAVIESDRRFFKRFPERRHRVRLASQSEIADLRAASGSRLNLPKGFEYLTAVRQIAPGVRMRVFLHATAGAWDDLPEDVAARIFDETSRGTGAVLDERGRRGTD